MVLRCLCSPWCGQEPDLARARTAPSPGSWPPRSASGKRPGAAYSPPTSRGAGDGSLKGLRHSCPSVSVHPCSHKASGILLLRLGYHSLHCKICMHWCGAGGGGWYESRPVLKRWGWGQHRTFWKLHEAMDHQATRQWPLMGAFQQAQRGIFIPGPLRAPGTSSMAPLRMALTFALYSKDSLEQDRLYSPAGWLFFWVYHLQMR